MFGWCLSRCSYARRKPADAASTTCQDAHTSVLPRFYSQKPFIEGRTATERTGSTLGTCPVDMLTPLLAWGAVCLAYRTNYMYFPCTILVISGKKLNSDKTPSLVPMRAVSVPVAVGYALSSSPWEHTSNAASKNNILRLIRPYDRKKCPRCHLDTLCKFR